MTQTEFTNKILLVFEEAMQTPDEYINPNYMASLLETIDAYINHNSDAYPEISDRMDKIHDYVIGMYGA